MSENPGIQTKTSGSLPPNIVQVVVMSLMGFIIAAFIGVGIVTLLEAHEYLTYGTVGGGFLGGITLAYMELR